MNLIKLYGNLKYSLANIENNIYQFGSGFGDVEYKEKIERLIQIVEYKIGILTQDEMDKDFFNEDIEKNNWVMHTLTYNYKKDDSCYHYYRKCYKCGNKWYSLHSRYEQEKRSCGCK